MTFWDWMIVLLLNGAIILYGFYLSRGTSSSRDWFLGGRVLPWWGLGLSAFATSVDNADLVSITGHVYNNGMHIMTVFTLAAVLGSCLAAFCIVPVMYRAGFYTNAEFLEARFGSTLRLLSALIQIQYRTAVLGLMVWSIYLLLHRMVGLQAWQAWTLIVLLVVLTAAYTAWGGLASVVWTDALQSVIILGAAACMFFSVWNGVGGWTGMQERMAVLPDPVWNAEQGWVGRPQTREAGPGEEGKPHTQPLSNWLHIGRFVDLQTKTPPLVILGGWIIIGLGYYCVNHTQTMRLMGARSLWDMKVAALFGAGLGIPVMLMIVLLGVLGRVVHPELTADGTKADEIVPILAQQFLQTGFRGLVVAGILSATISTFDSMGSALSALFTRDIYARWIRKDQSDQHYLLVSRWATVGILLIGFLYLPFIIKQHNMVDATLSLVSVFVTPLFIIYLLGATTRVHPRSGGIGLLVGGLFGVVCFLRREGILVDGMLGGLPDYVYGQWYVYLWSVAVTACTMFLATLLWGPAPRNLLQHAIPHPAADGDTPSVVAIERGGPTSWLTSSTEALPEIKEHPFEGDLPRWLEPRWLALVLVLLTSWLVVVCFW